MYNPIKDFFVTCGMPGKRLGDTTFFMLASVPVFCRWITIHSILIEKIPLMFSSFKVVVQTNESGNRKTKSYEERKVTHHAHLLSCDRCLHQQMNLFFAQEILLWSLLPCTPISSEWVFLQAIHYLWHGIPLYGDCGQNTIAEFIFKRLSVLEKSLVVCDKGSDNSFRAISFTW